MRMTMTQKDLDEFGDTHFCRCHKCGRKLNVNEKYEWHPLENIIECLPCYDKEREEWRIFREAIAENKPHE
jgi:NAD-dependent SIR2 family protein deacetylase